MVFYVISGETFRRKKNGKDIILLRRLSSPASSVSLDLEVEEWGTTRVTRQKEWLSTWKGREELYFIGRNVSLIDLQTFFAAVKKWDIMKEEVFCFRQGLKSRLCLDKLNWARAAASAGAVGGEHRPLAVVAAAKNSNSNGATTTTSGKG